jgi:hypothetical protein
MTTQKQLRSIVAVPQSGALTVRRFAIAKVGAECQAQIVPLTQEIIAESVARYRRESDRYLKLATFVAEQCRRIVGNNAIRATVQWRAKDPASLDLKLRRYMADNQRRDDFNSSREVFEKLKDLAGVRITTYVESDRDDVVRLLTEAFVGPGPNESVLVDKKDNNETFYRATHCQVILQRDDLIRCLPPLSSFHKRSDTAWPTSCPTGPRIFATQRASIVSTQPERRRAISPLCSNRLSSASLASFIDE